MAARSESWSPPAEPRRWAAATLAGALLLTGVWGLLHLGFFTHGEIVDTPVYQRYGDAMLDGQVPYRDFALEYPPAALPVFVLPSLAAASDYRHVFEGLMLACGLAIVALVACALVAAGVSRGRLYGAVALTALAPLALGPVVLTRFDLWPAALVAGAIAALATDRPRLGLGLLGVAVAAKLYPLVLLPVALVYVGRREGRREALLSLAVFAAVVSAIVVPFAVLAPDGLAHSLTRQSGRPLQIESLGAAVLLVGHQLELYVPNVVSSSGSQNLSGTFPDALAAVLTALEAIAVVGVWALYARLPGGRDRLFLGAAASVAAFVAFGKVLSPQFLIWLVPLVPLVVGTNGVGAGVLFVAALVLTQLWFPHGYWDLVGLGSQAWLVFVRDLVLVGLAAVLAAGLSRARSGAARSP